MRATQKDRMFNGVFQQKPSPESGSIFLKKHIIEKPLFAPNGKDELVKIRLPRVMAMDTATSERTSADFSALAMGWWTTDGKIVVQHTSRAKLNFPELLNWAKRNIEEQKVGQLIVEDASSGRQLIQTLKEQVPIPVLPFKPDRDKVYRANVVLPYFEAGKIIFAQPINFDLLAEMMRFPYGANDDMVDALVMLITYLIRRGPGSAGRQKPTPNLKSIYGR
jgi:predicted phage terminase large subunit-like protein